MTIKLIGAALVLCGCGGFGFSMAAAQRREEQSLRQILRAMEYMDCELQFRQTPLPQLCRNTSRVLSGPVRLVFQELASRMDRQAAPDVQGCMDGALSCFPGLGNRAREALTQLGDTLGLFDLPGQLRGFAAVAEVCREGIAELSENRGMRLRSYQTLGLCAGAALAILFL